MPTPKAKPSAPTADEVPISREMLASVRTEILQRIDQGREEARAEIHEAKAELKSDIHRLDAAIHEVKAELKSDIHKLDAAIHEVKAELKSDIHRLDTAIHEVKADIHEVKADIHEVKAGVARIEVLVEEQNVRNRIVLDGITALLSRQNQVEQRVVQVEDTVRKLAAVPPAG